jgi:hypothetical protein
MRKPGADVVAQRPDAWKVTEKLQLVTNAKQQAIGGGGSDTYRRAVMIWPDEPTTRSPSSRAWK